MHDLNETGGIVTLSSTSNANTTITNDEGTDVKYFTDFSKYFLTRSRANGEIVSIDENTAPYTTPTTAEPFIPTKTINGEIFLGAPTDPTANSDTRHEFSLTANTTGIGYAGANNDITENKWVGNTYVVLKLSNAAGTFSESESLTDFDNNSGTIKTQANTTTVVLDSGDVKGTFVSGEVVTDGLTNATVSSIQTISNTSSSITLTGNTFTTGGSTDVTLGFTKSSTISLDTDAVVRNENTVTITANNHGINAGERIALKGASDAFSEFNDTFIVTDSSDDTLQFETANSTSVTPTGDFSLVKNIYFGRTSNASGSVTSRTVNATAELRFQSSNLSVGFPVGNTVTGQSSAASGFIDERSIKGDWYQTKTNEVKTYYTASDSGTWDYDATNNANGIESTANTGEFWLKNLEMVKINQLVSSTGTGDTWVSPKIVLDIALATTTDTSGGYDSSQRTKVPGIYFAYPLKTYEDQVHDGVTTLEAYDNFANVVIAPEGLEINFDWKPLANASGTAVNTTHITSTGEPGSGLSAYAPEEVTVLDKSEFVAHLGPYSVVDPATAADDIYLSVIASNRSSAKKTDQGNSSTYPDIDDNPFYPAVSGTHKAKSNTASGITGTQPGTLGHDDIYAGGYQHDETGAVDPASKNNRYIIQNDLKWTYATNPFATGGTASSSNYKTPQNGNFLAAYDGEIDTEMDAVQDESADGTSGSVVMIIPENDDDIGANITGYNNSPQDAYRCDSNSGGVVQKAQRTVTRTNPSGDGATFVYTLNAWGSWAEFPCFYNRVRHLTTVSSNAGAIGGTKGSYTVANMETNFGLLYQLLKNLENADYGKDFDDPLEPSTSGYATGQGDASFKQETEDLKSAIDDLIEDHNTEVGRTYQTSFAYSGTADNSLTHPADYRTTYHANVITEVTSYRSVVKRRITEISNRIGYVNSKDTAGGGTTSSPAKSVSGTAEGFQGYSFNSGNGYANTVYSHCNFLAGKKIKLLEKILRAVEDIDALYDQIKTKRAEYYEYNQ